MAWRNDVTRYDKWKSTDEAGDDADDPRARRPDAGPRAHHPSRQCPGGSVPCDPYTFHTCGCCYIHCLCTPDPWDD